MTAQAEVHVRMTAIEGGLHRFPEHSLKSLPIFDIVIVDVYLTLQQVWITPSSDTISSIPCPRWFLQSPDLEPGLRCQSCIVTELIAWSVINHSLIM